VLIARIANAGFTPPSPQLCHIWHACKFTIAHHEEVGVSADGPASAPPSGAAADAPVAGADVCSMRISMKFVMDVI
jgi:hypothetical protein